ncbi:MAG TPA: hypothetical protein G4N96_07000 [Chloroflexi bacterium]|nr:hypothetical protein [Chloroflexota bacterium]
MRDRTTQILILIAALLAGLAWQQGGAALAAAGLIEGGKLLLNTVILLAAAFLIAGLIQTLVTEEAVSRWLGQKSGWKGIALACVGGALMPGGPYVYYPIAAALLHTGAGLGALVAFVTAKNLWSVSRIPLEFALLGPQLTLIRFAVTLIIPPLLGVLAETFFGGRVEQIRAAVRQ